MWSPEGGLLYKGSRDNDKVFRKILWINIGINFIFKKILLIFQLNVWIHDDIRDFPLLLIIGNEYSNNNIKIHTNKHE